MDYTIVDRREAPGGKNIPNRQKFIERAKDSLRKSVKKGLQDRSITSADDENVKIPTKSITEPRFRNKHGTGNADYVLPGNKEYVPGDLIDKPPSGGGAGREGSDTGEGQDDFEFALSEEEFYNIAFEDLELPRMLKKSMKAATNTQRQRAGFVSDGNPCQLDLARSMRNSIGRRKALHRPRKKEILALEELINNETDEGKVLELEAQLVKMRKKSKTVAFIDPVDLRFRNFENVPKPKSQAVMFCIMDVSASMGAGEKDLAKRFYILLYQFLIRKYKKVDVIFIRHHTSAKEVDEEEFFYSRETGGTVVSEGYVKMLEIQKERYPADDWNIYVSQASDGDNFQSDNRTLRQLFDNEVLPIVQFLTYLEVREMSDHSQYYGSNAVSSLWPNMESLANAHDNVVIEKIKSADEVYSVFRKIFLKENNNA